MPKDFTRHDRVADQIQRDLAELIRLEVKDPRVGMVTLTGVEVSRDYSHAKVFYTLLGNPDRMEDTQAGLDRAAGYLRSELFKRIKLFKMPQLHFVFDTSVEYGVNLSRLIDEVAKDLPPADDGHQNT
jgi:ribosome-binding factor A